MNSKTPITERSTVFRLARSIRTPVGIKRMVFIIGWPVTLIALFYGIENWRGHHAWKTYSKEARAKGIELNFKASLPKPVQDDQNFAATPLVRSWFEKTDGSQRREEDAFTKASSNVEQYRLRDRRARDLTDLQAWAMAFEAEEKRETVETAFASQVTNPEARAKAAEVVLTRLAPLNPAFEELRSVSERPESLFPINYDAEHPFAILLPHLPKLRHYAERLNLKACAELAAGRPDKALADLKLILRLSDSLRDETVLISRLVRQAIIRQADQPIWEGLQQHRWSQEQLDWIQKRLMDYNFLAEVPGALATERAAGIATIDYATERGGIEVLADGTPGEPRDEWARLLAIVSPSGWYGLEKVNYGKIFEDTVWQGWDPKTRRVWPEQVKRTKHTLEAALQGSPLGRLLEHRVAAAMLIPAVARVVERSAFTQSTTHQAALACELEKHRIKNGTYPETLQALPSALIGTAHDVLTGEPMKYRRDSDQQFTLYSVGWNEKDDGGKLGKTLYSEAEGDWLW